MLHIINQLFGFCKQDLYDLTISEQTLMVFWEVGPGVLTNSSLRMCY